MLTIRAQQFEMASHNQIFLVFPRTPSRCWLSIACWTLWSPPERPQTNEEEIAAAFFTTVQFGEQQLRLAAVYCLGLW